MSKLTKKAIRYGRTDGLTDPNYRKALLLIKYGIVDKLNCKMYLLTSVHCFIHVRSKGFSKQSQNI